MLKVNKTLSLQLRAGLLMLFAVGLAAVCTINSMRWIGSTFPGFFIMSNRVVASVSLPHWPTSERGIFQHELVAIDGITLRSASQAYTTVSEAPVGTTFEYKLLKDRTVTYFHAESLRFTARDYALIFVPYLISGVGLALIGIAVWSSKPSSPASLALLIGGLSGGLFAITATDLYSPYWFFRLHVLGEAFFPASLLVHLAAVFPVDRFHRGRRLLLTVPYIIATGLALPYELFLYNPNAYSLIHNLCMDFTGVGGLTLLTAVTWDFFTNDSQLVRQRIRVVLLGFLGGFAFPGMLMFYSGITGGQIPVNYAGYTVVLFPLSIGYAVVKHDLFEIDALVKRSVYYIATSATLLFAYLGFLGLMNWAARSVQIASSPLFPLLFTFVVVLAFNPFKDAVQRTIDKVFFRIHYNSKKVLEACSTELASTLQLDELVSFVWRTIEQTIPVVGSGVFIKTSESGSYRKLFPDSGATDIDENHPVIARLKHNHGRIISTYNFDNERSGDLDVSSMLNQLKAELLIPMAIEDELIGFLALGRKESGQFFSVDDVGFLRTLANQSAVSIANALAYREIQKLNAVLEQRVSERTEELSQSNRELSNSLRKLEQAYSDLKRSQQELSRAEKMATLGRLAAGIAHEINTPLGASMTSMRIMRDLVEEYAAAVTDTQVTAEDHREISAEMRNIVSSTSDWLRKAAAHISSLKLHTRALQSIDEKSFSILEVVENVSLLLTHRLRLAESRVVLECASPELMMYGDPGKLGQILTNLLSNAIDANRERRRPNLEIGVRIRRDGHNVVISIQDHGPGIASEFKERIFEEFYSTKPGGEGTGLGLSIARDLVSNYFKGSISVESVPGEGSTFTVVLANSGSSSEASPIT